MSIFPKKCVLNNSHYNDSLIKLNRIVRKERKTAIAICFFKSILWNCRIVFINNTAAMHTFFSHSLGITILELASDIDLPRGGQLWHNLRSGRLPDEFLKGRNIWTKWPACFVQAELCEFVSDGLFLCHWLITVGRSCELRRTIAWMMEPDPLKRPTVDEVLQSQTVQKCKPMLFKIYSCEIKYLVLFLKVTSGFWND